jgi:hypothetical protein
MENYDEKRPKRPSRTQSAVVTDEEQDSTPTDLSTEKIIFILLIFSWQIIILVIYAVWVRYQENDAVAEYQVVEFYDYFRSV